MNLYLLVTAAVAFVLPWVWIGSGSRLYLRERFAVADRTAGAWQIALSITATSIAMSGTLLLTQLYFRNGLVAAMIEVGGIIGLIGLAVFGATGLHSSGALSLPDFLRRRLHPVYGWWGLLGVMVAESLILTLAGLAVIRLTGLLAMGWLWPIALLVLSLFVAATGMKGVLRSHTSVLWWYAVGLVLLVLSTLLAERPFAVQWRQTLVLEPFTMFTLSTLFILPNFFSGAIYGRVLAATSASVARQGLLLAALLKGIMLVTLVTALWLALGLFPDIDRKEMVDNPILLRVIIEKVAGPLPAALISGAIIALFVAAAAASLQTLQVLLYGIVPARVEPRWWLRLLVAGISPLGCLVLLYGPDLMGKGVDYFYGFFLATTVVPAFYGMRLPHKVNFSLLFLPALFGGTVYVSAVLQKSPGDPVLWALAGAVLALPFGALITRLQR